MSEIKPVLTPEEWREVKGALANGATTEGIANWLCSEDATAAALLQRASPEGGPWFTHEDVKDELLLAHCAEAVTFRTDVSAEARVEAAGMARRHRSRAARIAALLPPETSDAVLVGDRT